MANKKENATKGNESDGFVQRTGYYPALYRHVAPDGTLRKDGLKVGARTIQGCGLLVGGRHKIPVVQDDHQVAFLHRLVVVDEYPVDPSGYLWCHIADMVVDEGVIGALVALGPGVIVGGAGDGQRDQDQQQQGPDAATSLPDVGLGLLLAHRETLRVTLTGNGFGWSSLAAHRSNPHRRLRTSSVKRSAHTLSVFSLR